jgi:5-methylcytosine-specific restriction protein A
MRIRDAVMARDCGLCVACQAKGKITPGAEIDHKVALVNGGDDNPDNLQTLCKECHREKTAQDTGTTYRPEIGLDGWLVNR